MSAGARGGRASVAATDATVRACAPVTPGGRGRLRAAVAATLLAGCVAAALPAASFAFNLEDVAEKARKLAEEPFQDPSGRVPQWLTTVTYDQWRDVRFRADRALWKDRTLPFEVQFFHPGLFYDRIVAINEVEAGNVLPVTFSPSMFDYGRNDFASRVPQDLGFAGFRLHYPIKNSTYKDEVIVFVGASYFRAVGKNQVFGISARGLAIDTAAPSGEEFPYFREYWLVRPTRDAKSMSVYALLDSPSLTGAYKFVVHPAEQTVVEVEGRIFRRRDIAKLGIAPLTSMFLFGENSTRCFDNYRPEVHDSDGLLLHNDTGEWLWRPVDNPATLQVHAYQMTNPRGFGLLQRDRKFENYQDLETSQEKRPSTWIVPKGQWGPGRVELVEIPTPQDIHDNVVAYWIYDQLPPLGQPINFAYKMLWFGEDAALPPAGRAVATRREKGSADNRYRFVVDFEGKALARLPDDEILRAAVTVTGGDAVGKIVDQYVIKSAPTSAWRLGFQVEVATREPVELRAYLDKAGSALTETWSYTLIP